MLYIIIKFLKWFSETMVFLSLLFIFICIGFKSIVLNFVMVSFWGELLS